MRTTTGTVAALGLLLMSIPAAAEFRVGVLGGGNLASLKERPEEADVIFDTKGFSLGGVVVDVGVTDAVSVRLEPMYVQKGSSVELLDFFGEDLKSTLRMSYLELPVLLKVARSSGRVRPYLVAGPSIGYRGKVIVRDPESGAEEEPDDTDELFEKWDFGVGGGGGLSVEAGRTAVFAEGRYTWGLSAMNKEEEGEELKLKHRGAQILAGIMVRVGK